jgi:hypothetical protein
MTRKNRFRAVGAEKCKKYSLNIEKQSMQNGIFVVE